MSDWENQPTSWERHRCPWCYMADGKEKPNLSVAEGSGYYCCHRCGEKGFVQHLMRAEEPAIREFLADLKRLPAIRKRVEPPKDSWLPNGFKEVTATDGDINAMSVWRYLRKERGLSIATIQKSRAGYCTEWPLHVVFPMPDETGYTVRPVVPGQSGYRHSKGFPRSTAIYDPFAVLGKKGITVYITEGNIDVLAPGPPTVATLGKGVTDAQVERLAAHPGFLVAAYDGDAWRENQALARRLKLRGAKAGWVRLPAGEDPGSLGKNLFDFRVRPA